MSLIGATAKQQLVGLVEMVLDESEKQRAFVSSCFYQVPKLASQLKTGQPARVFAIHLVTATLMYGDIGGQPAINLLIDELSNWLGEDRQQQLDAIRVGLRPKPPLTQTTTQPIIRATTSTTDEMIENFYKLYDERRWDAALAVLDTLATADDLPRLFDIQVYRHEISNRAGSKQVTYDREREYRLLKLRARYESRERVWEGLKLFWHAYPGYDSDDIANWIFEEAAPYQEAMRRIEAAYHSGATTLNLNEMGLEVLPSAIGYLTNLEWLSIAENKLVTLPRAVSFLTELDTLHAEQNNLATFPPGLLRSRSLRHLFLDDNRIDYLPPKIQQMTQLYTLGLRQNRLREIPAQIAQLNSLSVFVLDNNELTSLPPEVFLLLDLTWLLLSGNQIPVLPPAVGHLHNLRLLSLTHNAMQSLPHELGGLPRLENLFVVRGNPLNELPPQVVSQGNGAVLQWLREQVKD